MGRREPLLTPETERLVLLPLKNPETNHGSTKFKYAGSADVIDGARLIDWKSCASPEQFAAKKAMSFQPECYAKALQRLGYDIQEFEYRVIQKPALRFSAKDNGDARAYEDRCYEWLLEKPGRVQSIVYPITYGSLKQAEEWLWGVTRRILEARRSGNYLTNENACNAFNKVCEFAPLCKAAKTGDDVGGVMTAEYEMRERIHEELDLPDGFNPVNIITYSSASTFTLCEQKYYWNNVLALRPKGDEQSEALYIGSAMHEGLERLYDKGLAGAMSRVEEWAKKNPVIGPDATHKQQQDIAKARAMIRAAATYWHIGEEQ